MLWFIGSRCRSGGPGARTTYSEIEVYGSETSGEVEYVLCIVTEDEVYVGLGSDHTDRHLEEVDIPRAKQICPNLMGRKVWPLEEVESHWDDLLMNASAVKDGKETLYQEGRLGLLLNPAELMAGGFTQDRETLLGNRSEDSWHYKFLLESTPYLTNFAMIRIEINQRVIFSNNFP